jgi:heme-degrading monooxygenase HmoA
LARTRLSVFRRAHVGRRLAHASTRRTPAGDRALAGWCFGITALFHWRDSFEQERRRSGVIGLRELGPARTESRFLRTQTTGATLSLGELVRSSGRGDVISRHWTGVVKPGLAGAYIAHLERETLPVLARLSGFISASILRREVKEGTEFQIITRWASVEAITRFAGPDPEGAVVPAAAEALMVRFDRRACHYEVVNER